MIGYVSFTSRGSDSASCPVPTGDPRDYSSSAKRDHFIGQCIHVYKRFCITRKIPNALPFHQVPGVLRVGVPVAREGTHRTIERDVSPCRLWR